VIIMEPAIHMLSWFAAIVLAPLLTGVINRTKAFFGGRKGQPLFQAYYDLGKLLRKGAVYSQTTSWIFRAAPIVGLAVTLTALLLIPVGGFESVLSFRGDFIFLAYVLGLMRFLTVLAALDTGSAFEGMGASREMQFSLLAEPVLLSCLAVLATGTGCLNLSGMVADLWSVSQPRTDAAILLVAGSLLIVLLTENARIPVDDPATHLELTMIHEVMILDHGGIDLAFIEYASALKLWIFAALLSGIVIPFRAGTPLVDLVFGIAGIFLTAVVIGIIESTMARMRLLRIPQMLIAAMALSITAFIWVLK